MSDLPTLAEQARRDESVIVPAALEDLHHRARARRTRKRIVAGALSLVLVALLGTGLVVASARSGSDREVISGSTGPSGSAPVTSAPMPSVPPTVASSVTSSMAPAVPPTVSPTVPPTPSPSPTEAPITTAVAQNLDCEPIGFTPGTDDVAGSIEATGVTCAEAHAFIRSVHTGPISYPYDSFSLNGYDCGVVRVEQELPATNFTCTAAGGRRITWTKT